MNSFGFIITRHVNSENTNRYWNHSIKLLRTLYPYKKIVIIDDNSNNDFVKPDAEYRNVTIIQSEFHGRGELLPYYYFIKNKFFENAIIIHDSVFFHKRIPFEALNGINAISLWHFNQDKENLQNSLRITNRLNYAQNVQDGLNFPDFTVLGMETNKWNGCFGCQAYINHNFLLQLENKYNISSMIHSVKNRSDRCCLERIFGYIFSVEYPITFKQKSLFGNITKKYKNFQYTFDNYEDDLKKGTIPTNVVKVWTGR
jgi:hypothetical protein